MPLIASILMRSMGMNEDQRRDFLWDNPILIVRGRTVHRIAGFDRRLACWVTFCRIPYEGNAHEEEAMEGTINCMMCMVG